MIRNPNCLMSRFLLPIILLLVLAYTSQAQVKVANYSYGKYGTDKYEQFAFYTKEGKRTDITYSYGNQDKDVKLTYEGKTKIKGDSCFKVQFPNNYTLYVIPKEFRLRITDISGKYDNTFLWQYEGPVKGIGTHCEACAENETDALNMLLSSYLK